MSSESSDTDVDYLLVSKAHKIVLWIDLTSKQALEKPYESDSCDSVLERRPSVKKNIESVSFGTKTPGKGEFDMETPGWGEGCQCGLCQRNRRDGPLKDDSLKAPGKGVKRGLSPEADTQNKKMKRWGEFGTETPGWGEFSTDPSGWGARRRLSMRIMSNE